MILEDHQVQVHNQYYNNRSYNHHNNHQDHNTSPSTHHRLLHHGLQRRVQAMHNRHLHGVVTGVLIVDVIHVSPESQNHRLLNNNLHLLLYNNHHLIGAGREIILMDWYRTNLRINLHKGMHQHRVQAPLQIMDLIRSLLSSLILHRS